MPNFVKILKAKNTNVHLGLENAANSNGLTKFCVGLPYQV